MSNSQTPEPAFERTLRSSARNPRRRQRQSDGDSIRTAPRRKRSKLNDDAFAQQPVESVEMGELTTTTGKMMNGHARGSGGRRKDSTPALSVDMELPMRGGKKPSGTGAVVKRAMKGDGATVLAANRVYSVKLLPSTPKELRKPGMEFRGSLLSEQHLALAVTRQKAYVWDYTAHAPATNARVFDVPFAAPQDEALPFGALVHSGANTTDVGLVLVAAHGGKVVFYESVERAASLGLFHERGTGVEGALTGLYTGESVTEITFAEHAGYVLTLSSGRVLQMRLRDEQGRARIHAQVLPSVEPASRGLFGTIKRFAGLVSKNVTAVRTRPLGTRGQMQALALTGAGVVETWVMDWSGRSEPRGTVDFRELLISELKSLGSPEMQSRAENLACLDFAIRDKPAAVRGDEVATLSTEQSIDLWLLLSIGGTDTKEFFVTELTLAGAMAEITRMTRLDSYYGHGTKDGFVTKPRLIIPKPGHTAFVAFHDAVVLAATADDAMSEPDPNAQLHEASYIAPGSFEDAIFLRSDTDAAIMGVSEEPSKAGNASCLAFVRGTGLVRFAATDPVGDVERSRMPAKSKIEEAVFYGRAMQPDNILEFGRNGGNGYSVEEVEEATLAVSDELLRSDTNFVSKNPTSIRAHLDYKARALRALITHVSQTYPALSRTAMWQLLWDAERVAAAQQLWQAFEQDKDAAWKGTKTARVLDELCRQAAEKYLWDEGDGDSVQTFFVKHLDKLSWLLAHTRALLEQIQETPPETKKILTTVEGVDEIWLRVIETVFTFRADLAAAYSIPSESLEDGILTDPAQYVELSESWISTEKMLKTVIKICTWSRELAKQYFDDVETMPEVETHCRGITVSNPRLVHLCCLIYQDRINWLASRDSEKDRQLAETLRENYGLERHDQFRALADVAQAAEGMKLAEKYRDMRTLTEIVVAESQYALETRATAQNEREKAACENAISDGIVRIKRYFGRFGDDWANAFFDEAFSSSRAGLMLAESQQYWGDALTRYLRAEPSRARLCWINDVTAQQDYARAGAALVETAAEQETKLWAKKVESSISKLAVLAAAEGPSPEGEAPPQDLIVKNDRQLQIVDIQENLYLQFYPEIVQGIDHEAELDMVMHKFGSHLHDYSSLRLLLETGVDRILRHDALSIAELIDVLTLVDVGTSLSALEHNQQGSQLYLALVVLDAAASVGLHAARFEVLLHLIWKRCYIADDDWVTIDSAQSGSKGASHEQLWSHIRKGTVWGMFYHIHDQQLLLERPDSGIRVLTPSDCLGAGCLPQDLQWRFEDWDLLGPILHDNQIQDELLQSYVDDRRLDAWVEEVEKDAKNFAERRIEEEAMARGMVRERADRIQKMDPEEAKVNGYVNGVEEGVEGKGNEDVEME